MDEACQKRKTYREGQKIQENKFLKTAEFADVKTFGRLNDRLNVKIAGLASSTPLFFQF